MNLSKLCRKDIEKFCFFCQYTNNPMDNSFLICKYYGKVEPTHICKKYKYDPLKRKPPSRVKVKTNLDLGDL